MMEIVHTFILILHILGACIYVGAAAFAIIIYWHPELIKSAKHFMPVIGKLSQLAAIAQLITGGYLFGSEHAEIESNHLIWIKLLLYVVDGVIAGVLISRESKKQNIPKLKPLLWIHLILIVFIVALGVGVAETPNE